MELIFVKRAASKRCLLSNDHGDPGSTVGPGIHPDARERSRIAVRSLEPDQEITLIPMITDPSAFPAETIPGSSR